MALRFAPNVATASAVWERINATARLIVARLPTKAKPNASLPAAVGTTAIVLPDVFLIPNPNGSTLKAWLAPPSASKTINAIVPLVNIGHRAKKAALLIHVPEKMKRLPLPNPNAVPDLKENMPTMMIAPSVKTALVLSEGLFA